MISLVSQEKTCYKRSGKVVIMTERILVPGCFSIHDGFLAPTQALAMYVALTQET
jgi:hypothetical protein